MQDKQTNAREARISALSSPSEVVRILIRIEKNENKGQGNMKRLAVKTITSH